MAPTPAKRCSIIDSVTTKPDMTKKTSTPVKPPGSHARSMWQAMTESTAMARSPSMAGM